MSTFPPRPLDYALVDVFAEHPLQGNMLAIFTDARGLSTEQMQALARETNLSETTFILPAEGPEAEALERTHGVHVRIFTTTEELPFAGHPTLGTASWLFWNHPTLRGSEEILLRLAVGAIPVRFRQPVLDEAGKSTEVGVFASMRPQDPVFGATHDRVAVAAALNLSPDDIDASSPIQTVSTGLPFCIVPLRSVAVANRLQIPQDRAQAYLEASDAKFFFCLAPVEKPVLSSPTEIDSADWHCRMQFYNGEDPATGSASGCAIAYLVLHGLAPSGHPVVFEQGIEMLRPSKIHVQATLRGQTVTDLFVSGRTIPVALGRFILP